MICKHGMKPGKLLQSLCFGLTVTGVEGAESGYNRGSRCCWRGDNWCWSPTAWQLIFISIYQGITQSVWVVSYFTEYRQSFCIYLILMEADPLNLSSLSFPIYPESYSSTRHQQMLVIAW